MSTRGAVIDGVIFCVLLFVYFLHMFFAFVYFRDPRKRLMKESGDVNDQRPQPSPPVSSLGSKQELPSRSRARTPGRGEKRKRVKKQAPASTRGEKRKQGERVKKQREGRGGGKRGGGGKRTQPCAQINLDPIQGRETIEEEAAKQ